MPLDYNINNQDPSYIDPREYKAEQLQNFLRKISMLESSGGKNINHPEVTSGLNAGTSAVGEYGLMPLTAQDLDRQNGINKLTNLSPEEVSDKLSSDQDLYKRISETLASKLLNKNPSDVAAYKWEHGQYSNPSQNEIEQSGRVKQFRVLNRSPAGT